MAPAEDTTRTRNHASHSLHAVAHTTRTRATGRDTPPLVIRREASSSSSIPLDECVDKFFCIFYSWDVSGNRVFTQILIE